MRYKGKNIYDVLEMTIEEALDFFSVHTRITAKLQTLYDVGLGYVKLGQPSTTLSGGEAQRIKLATELSRRATGRTLYVLDEPTTGLHVADVERLNEVLQRLADAGNTLVIIEHNLDIIKTADYILDIGPEGGDRGGEIIATGTPEEIAQNPNNSYTGAFFEKNFIIATMTFFSQAAEYRVLGEKSACQKVFLTSWWTGEQAIHNSQWSPCCAWRLAVLPCSLGLLRAASPTGRALRAPPATTTSTIRNGRLAAPDGLQYFLAHWAYYGLFRAPRAAFVRPLQFPLKSYGFPGAETARKRFLLWKMGFSGAKIAPSPPYTPPGTILMREGFVPQFAIVALLRYRLQRFFAHWTSASPVSATGGGEAPSLALSMVFR